MKKRKLFWKVLRIVQADKILYGYIGTFLLIAVGIMLVEPTITSYGDSLWYCYVFASTIGFGDFVATNIFSRILTVILSLYSIVIVALIPTVLVNYYLEFVAVRKNESSLVFVDKLQNLNKLSKEELKEISEIIKKNMKK